MRAEAQSLGRISQRYTFNAGAQTGRVKVKVKRCITRAKVTTTRVWFWGGKVLSRGMSPSGPSNPNSNAANLGDGVEGGDGSRVAAAFGDLPVAAQRVEARQALVAVGFVPGGDYGFHRV